MTIQAFFIFTVGFLACGLAMNRSASVQFYRETGIAVSKFSNSSETNKLIYSKYGRQYLLGNLISILALAPLVFVVFLFPRWSVQPGRTLRSYAVCFIACGVARLFYDWLKKQGTGKAAREPIPVRDPLTKLLLCALWLAFTSGVAAMIASFVLR